MARRKAGSKGRATSANGINFDIQTYLAGMKLDQETRHTQLSDKIDDILDTVGSHETRLSVVESKKTTSTWVMGILMGGFIGTLFEMGREAFTSLFKRVAP